MIIMCILTGFKSNSPTALALGVLISSIAVATMCTTRRRLVARIACKTQCFCNVFSRNIGASGRRATSISGIVKNHCKTQCF